VVFGSKSIGWKFPVNEVPWTFMPDSLCLWWFYVYLHVTVMARVHLSVTPSQTPNKQSTTGMRFLEFRNVVMLKWNRN